MNWIAKMSKQPSTWRGLILIATAGGLTLTDFQTEAVIALGLAFAGCIGAFVSDP